MDDEKFRGVFCWFFFWLFFVFGGGGRGRGGNRGGEIWGIFGSFRLFCFSSFFGFLFSFLYRNRNNKKKREKTNMAALPVVALLRSAVVGSALKAAMLRLFKAAILEVGPPRFLKGAMLPETPRLLKGAMLLLKGQCRHGARRALQCHIETSARPKRPQNASKFPHNAPKFPTMPPNPPSRPDAPPPVVPHFPIFTHSLPISDPKGPLRPRPHPGHAPPNSPALFRHLSTAPSLSHAHMGRSSLPHKPRPATLPSLPIGR